jgi:hypothetical protein
MNFKFNNSLRLSFSFTYVHVERKFWSQSRQPWLHNMHKGRFCHRVFFCIQ